MVMSASHNRDDTLLRHLSLHMDSILIQDLEVSCRVGVTPEERANPQRLLLSIEMRRELSTAALSDDRTLLVAYLPELQSVTVDFGYLNGDVFDVSFFDPRTGQTVKTQTVQETKVRRIPSPPAEDLVLLVRVSRARK